MVFSGKALMNGGILLPGELGDNYPFEFIFEALPEKTIRISPIRISSVF